MKQLTGEEPSVPIDLPTPGSTEIDAKGRIKSGNLSNENELNASMSNVLPLLQKKTRKGKAVVPTDEDKLAKESRTIFVGNLPLNVATNKVKCIVCLENCNQIRLD